MKESDWKIFKNIKENAVELFCNNVLSEYQEVIQGKDKNAHEAYVLLYELVQNRDKQMALLFDGHSRSKAHLQLLANSSRGFS